MESGFNSEALVKAFSEAVKLPLAKYASPRHSQTWLKNKITANYTLRYLFI